ncbi:hypothetical protein QUW63_06555 [Pseudoflavonifractor phocaeensis]|uniref:hypothetical protein n=1 Tax=Pseudoflavonifractor phocaeensis TaxID=1870988 RepID=UPI0025A47113|nr:hypothetical protein [Pseudoflavonifractor phocaeensis]MDM8238764.1 hypothetical protein [Pseudoflavonifractor phocaeensis]
MALEIVAAKDLNHAFEIVSVSPRKTMKHHVVSEPEGMDGFLYDTRNELTNYTDYYQFDPYREIQLEADQVSAIKTFSRSIVKWLEEHCTEENRVIGQYGLSFPKIRRFADKLGHVCDVAMEHGYGLSDLGD